jgi:copper chaperone NosL
MFPSFPSSPLAAIAAARGAAVDAARPGRFFAWRAARRSAVLAALVAIVGVLSGCDAREPTAPPPAAEVTPEATGHYCGMLLGEHSGPKGQIHLASRSAPIWFSSVRDTIAFLRLPEEPRDIAAVYVNDMGQAQRWEQPEPGTWIDARQAWFVIESARRGGMGAPEAVPFAEQAAADAFAAQHGGRVVRIDDIPDAYVIGPVETAPSPAGGAHRGH